MNPKRIIVADDESHIRNVVKIKLSNAGYEVVDVPDGDQALAAFDDERPALVITDYHMPGCDGIGLVRGLVEKYPDDLPPIVMLTAQGHELPDDDARSAISRMMSKPFSPRQLVALVEEVLAEAYAKAA
ncbi:MAG: response regulator [Planctomycetota bacterium]